MSWKSNAPIQAGGEVSSPAFSFESLGKGLWPCSIIRKASFFQFKLNLNWARGSAGAVKLVFF